MEEILNVAKELGLKYGKYAIGAIAGITVAGITEAVSTKKKIDHAEEIVNGSSDKVTAEVVEEKKESKIKKFFNKNKEEKIIDAEVVEVKEQEPAPAVDPVQAKIDEIKANAEQAIKEVQEAAQQTVAQDLDTPKPVQFTTVQ